jgi:hypothetical protein
VSPAPAIPAATVSPVTATQRRAVAGPVAPRSTTANAPIGTAAAVDGPVAAEPILTDSVPLTEAVGQAQAVPQLSAVSPTERQQADLTEALAQILAGLLVAGVAIGGLVLLMRRRRPASVEPVPAIERPVLRSPATDNLRVAEDRMFVPAPMAAAEPTQAPSAGEVLPTAGAAVALPREAPSDPVARTKLLRRMVAARPDRANPFRSPKARLHRARLILQSLGRRFENATPRIDLSDYTGNWPALARHNRLAAT